MKKPRWLADPLVLGNMGEASIPPWMLLGSYHVSVKITGIGCYECSKEKFPNLFAALSMRLERKRRKIPGFW